MKRVDIKSSNNKILWSIYSYFYNTLNFFSPYKKLLKDVLKEAEIKPKDHVLDLGAGTCNLEKISNCGIFTSLDYSSEMLEKNKKEKKICSFIIHDLNKVPFPLKSNSFDKAISVNLLYNIDNIDDFFKETYRCTKKGGKVVISSSDNSGFGSLLEDHFKDRSIKNIFFSILFFIPFIFVVVINFYIDRKFRNNFYNSEKVVTIMRKIGFKNIKSIKAYSGINFLISGYK